MESYLTKKLDFADCTCPICMSILIEPVTMPCEHELCMPCFKQNVEEANFTCPMCRKRISTWVRRATKTNCLVNKKRWKQIQRAFPKKVQNRLEGKEDDYSSDEDVVIIPSIAEPGAIREEYLKELKKIEAEQERVRQIEEEASRRLIEQLASEEERQRQEQERLQKDDEALARQLMETMHKEKKFTTPEINRFLNEQSMNNSRASSTTGTVSRNLSTFLDNYLVKTPKSQKSESSTYNTLMSPTVETRTGSRHTGVESADGSVSYIYIDSRESSCVNDFEASQEKLPSLPFVDLKEDSCDSSSMELNLINPAAAFKPSSIPPDSDTNFTIAISDTYSTASTPSQLTGSVDSTQAHCSTAAPDKANKKPQTMSDFVKTLKDTGQCKRSHSAASEDSISQELVHFKPIHALPRTPPKVLPGGKTLGNPEVIRSTPRNLKMKAETSSTEGKVEECLNPDILSSPIMRRRLTELASERQQQVAAHSKSTSTEAQVSREVDVSPPKKRLLRQHLRQEKHKATATVSRPDDDQDLCTLEDLQSTKGPNNCKENKSPSTNLVPLDSGFESGNEEAVPNSTKKTKSSNVGNRSTAKEFGFPVSCSPKTSQNNGRVYIMATQSKSTSKASAKASQQSNKRKRCSSASSMSHPKSSLRSWFELQASNGDSDSVPCKRVRQSSPPRSRSTTTNPKDMNHNCINEQRSFDQEKEDLLLAMKLQAEFDKEAKYNWNVLRRKEVDGEYSLRVRKRADASQAADAEEEC